MLATWAALHLDTHHAKQAAAAVEREARADAAKKRKQKPKQRRATRVAETAPELQHKRLLDMVASVASGANGVGVGVTDDNGELANVAVGASGSSFAAPINCDTSNQQSQDEDAMRVHVKAGC